MGPRATTVRLQRGHELTNRMLGFNHPARPRPHACQKITMSKLSEAGRAQTQRLFDSGTSRMEGRRCRCRVAGDQLDISARGDSRRARAARKPASCRGDSMTPQDTDETMIRPYCSTRDRLRLSCPGTSATPRSGQDDDQRKNGHDSQSRTEPIVPDPVAACIRFAERRPE
jgi:hypothetical protein